MSATHTWRRPSPPACARPTRPRGARRAGRRPQPGVSSGSWPRFDDPRLRLVRHERQPRDRRGLQHDHPRGRGELIAMLGDDDVSRARPHRPPGRRLRPPSRHRRGPRRRVDHRRPGRAARHVAEPGPRAPRAAAPSRARAQHAGRPLAHGPPPRLRGRRRLQQCLPAGPGLRLLAARAARLPLPRRARRAAHRLAPPRRELLRRVRPGARGAGGAERACAR